MPLRKKIRTSTKTASRIIKTSVVLSRDEERRFRAYADLKCFSFSALVRDAIDEYLAKYVEPMFPTRTEEAS